MSQEDECAGGRRAPGSAADGLGALYLERQGLKRVAGAKDGARRP